MSPKVPKAYLAARRDEIIKAAYRCFAVKGFHNTTMQDIYEATKLSPGAVYNYFSSKEDIVIGAVKQNADAALSAAAPIFTGGKDDSVLSLFSLMYDSIIHHDIREDWGVQMAFYAEAARNQAIREAMIESMTATGKRLSPYILRGQDAGLFSKELDPVYIAHIIIGMVFTAAIHKMVDDNFDLEKYRRVCEAMLTGGFSPPHRKQDTAVKKPRKPSGKAKTGKGLAA
jgi:AcrR family transcriptional regulator